MIKSAFLLFSSNSFNMWPFPDFQRVNLLHFLFFCILMLRFVTSCDSCGPGKTAFKRAGAPKKFLNKPLREKQFLPKVDEYSHKASGPSEGKILRKTRRFRNSLVRVDSPNIIFRDEERTGADRYMTRRCREKLEILAIMVRNEWPGVKLYVTEAFDENYAHKKQSLHYEGRAVDIKTDDRDRKKYGVLARLAVQAGFDWVFFESKAHIHVSCKSDTAEFQMHWKDERCFHADQSTVIRKLPKQPNATESVRMKDLKIGDEVLSTDVSGRPVFSQLIAWIDADLTSKSFFLRIKTEKNSTLILTPSHSVFVEGKWGKLVSRFAGDLSLGDRLVSPFQSRDLSQPQDPSQSRDVSFLRIVAIEEEISVGSLAPLTRQGTIVVNGIAASCYAAMTNTKVAHAAFAPLRWWTSIVGVAETEAPPAGLHPYAKILTIFSKIFLPSSFFFNSSASKL